MLAPSEGTAAIVESHAVGLIRLFCMIVPQDQQIQFHVEFSMKLIALSV